jgi:hypothetical protein
VLDLLKQRLRELNAEQPFIFGEFNAWAYEHTDNIQAGIAQEMINALTGSPNPLQSLYAANASFCKKIKSVLIADVSRLISAVANMIPVFPGVSLRWFIARCQLTVKFSYKTYPIKLLKIILFLVIASMPWFTDWFEGLIDFAGFSRNSSKWIWTGGICLYTLREFGKLIISPQAKELLTYLRLPSYAKHLGDIPVMREHIGTLCKLRLKEGNGKTPRLLFVVDDLDRCSPETILKVFEAVRLVLDLENVIVVIAVDQHIALAALSEHFRDFSPHHKLKNSHAIAREYLSKVINLPIVLTDPSSTDIKSLMESLWEKMNKEYEDELKLENISQAVNKLSDEKKVEVAPNHKMGVMPEFESSEEPTPALLPNSTSIEKAPDIDTAEFSQPQTIIKPIKALSKRQQDSFVYWVNYFSLSNARQIKRLNNSYDLMRSYLPQWDRSPFDFVFSESEHLKVYPMLLTLILMEYLNSLHDFDERKQLWGELFFDSSHQESQFQDNEVPLKDKEFKNEKVSLEFIKAYRSMLVMQEHGQLVTNVEAFVLPTMQ